MNSQKGQGALEYILLLFFIVSVAFGMLWQFNSAFKQYASNYFGNYMACILEYGELPSLGGGPSIGCDAEFEEFSLANGRPARGFKGIDDDKATDEDSADKNKSGPSRRDQNVAGGNSSSNSSPFGARNSRSRGGNRGANARVGPGSASEGDESDDGGMTIAPRGKEGTSARVTTIDRRRIPIKMDEVEAKKEKEKAKISKLDSEEGQVLIENKRLPVREPSATKRNNDEDDSIDLGLGGFLRILFIVAIIIALFILLGSQGLQISKEWD